MTARDIDTLLAIQTYAVKNGFPPSVADVMASIGLKSTSTAHERIRRLHAAGLVTWRKHACRSLVLTDAGRQALRELVL